MALETIREMVENDTTQPNEKVVAILYNGQAAEQTFKEVWKTLALLFINNDVETMQDLEALFLSSLPDNWLEDAPTKKVKGNDSPVITWRSWPVTKNTWKYATYVTKAISIHGADVVFPEEEALPTVQQVKDLAYKQNEKVKSDKSDFEKFQIALQNMVTAYGKLEGTEKDSATVLVNTAVTNFK